MSLLKNRNFWLGLTVFAGVVYFWPGSSDTDNRQTSKKKTTVIRHADGTLEEVENTPSIFFEDEPMAFDELMAAVKKGQIKLISELWKLRRQCPKDITFDECDAGILELLKKQYPDSYEELAELLGNYQKYEKRMRNIGSEELPTDPKARFARIKEIRREELGEADAQLVFGYEETRVGFGEALGKFLDDNDKLSGDEKMAAFEEFKKGYYGDYMETISERESSFDVYNTELVVRENDLDAMSASDRSGAVNEIRVRYFGEDGAKRMAEVEAQLAEEKKQLALMDQKEAEFLANNPNLSGDALESKLMELRTSILGKEAAEAYARRKKLQSAGKTN